MQTKITKNKVIAAFLGLAALLSGAVSPLQARKVDLDVAVSNPVIMAGEASRTHLKVGLTGFDLKRKDRSGINLALVLDRSGSMSGQKLNRAREAARMVVGMLGENDIFSLVTYDDSVEVLVPATKLNDKGEAYQRIDRISPGGSTALFAGVSKGLAEVRKFAGRDRVNRVILLSDGLANVGPSSPDALARLGRSAGKEGIAVTTVGLGTGYNEDLMTRLAQASDGNHAFVENAVDLARIFEEELRDALSVVAQEVVIRIQCAPGVRPLKVLDRDAEIRGRDVTLNLNQLYSNQEKYVLLEVEVPKGKEGRKKDIASVDVAYRNMATDRKEKLEAGTSISYSASRREVKRSANKKVIIDAVKSQANEARQQAIELRDKGDVRGAQRALQGAAAGFSSAADEYDIPMSEVAPAASQYKQEAEEVEKSDWNRTRKSLKAKEYKQKNQTRY